ncbi:MAG: hypothetical protein ACOC21_03465 [Halanaerobiales bacterium]
MLDKNNINQKIFFLFIEKYDQLFDRGEISKKERDAVFSLLEEHEKYDPQTFQKKLNSIFQNNEKDNK